MATATSQDTKTIIAVLLLIFLYPIGFLMMWLGTKWSLWVKLLVSIPAAFIVLIIWIIKIGTSG